MWQSLVLIYVLLVLGFHFNNFLAKLLVSVEITYTMLVLKISLCIMSSPNLGVFCLYAYSIIINLFVNFLSICVYNFSFSGFVTIHVG